MKFEIFPGRWMYKPKGTCVKQLTVHFDPFKLRGLTARPVQLISHKRMVQVCHVDSDLMGASGLELCPHEGLLSKALQHFDMCHSVSRAASVNGVAHAVPLIPADRFVYGKLVFTDVVINKSGIFSCDTVLLQLGRERLVSPVILGYHQTCGLCPDV